MRKAFYFLLLFGILGVTEARADDATRNVQIALKNRGFYYGEVDGLRGPETEAAVRRFQIRNGLSVTGTLTEETTLALNRPPSSSAPTPPGMAADPEAPLEEYRESDQEFLQSNTRPPRSYSTPAPPSQRTVTREQEREERYRDPRQDREPARYERYEDDGVRPGYVPPPVSIPSPLGEDLYADMFYGTDLEDAPIEVQLRVVREAQVRLARLRYYRGDIDGIPGPATEEALARFQDDGRRRVTGRLDMTTMDDLGLLRSRSRPTISFGIRFGDNRVYRGIEISH